MQIKMPSAEKSNTSPPIKSQTQLGTLLPESCSNQEGSAGFCSFLRKLLFSAKSVKKSSDLNCKYASKLFFGTSVYKSISPLKTPGSTIGATGSSSGSILVGSGDGSGYFKGSTGVGVIGGVGSGSFMGSTGVGVTGGVGSGSFPGS